MQRSRKVYRYLGIITVVITVITLSLTQLSHITQAALTTCDGQPYLRFARDYTFYPLFNTPEGKLNLYVLIDKLENDCNPDYSWYYYFVKIQTVPGTLLYDNGWETSFTDAKHVLFNGGTTRWIVDYGPTTTNGYTSASATVSITLTVQDVGILYSYTYGYSIPYVKVIDQSDLSQHLVKWVHDFNTFGDPPGSPSDSTYYAEPGFVVKTTEASASFVDANYGVGWCKPLECASYFSSTIYLDAYPWD